MSPINFFEEDISFTLPKQAGVVHWINEVIHLEGYETKDLNFIFCSDEYLHKINLEYLNHDTYTDIITFDNSEGDDVLEGDIFISIERIKENAREMSITVEDELHRVMIHGVLHLMGYGDKTPDEKEVMRKKEDACLSLRNRS